MLDYSQAELETGRPTLSAPQGIDFCLDRLYADNRHTLSNMVVDGLSFEELIGALLIARDEIHLLSED